VRPSARSAWRVRAGLHTGECERIGNEVGGIAVHIGARVVATAGASEVLVSSTVKDLVVGSGIKFKDRGVHKLKGVPDIVDFELAKRHIKMPSNVRILVNEILPRILIFLIPKPVRRSGQQRRSTNIRSSFRYLCRRA
jgi:hypothetical protein